MSEVLSYSLSSLTIYHYASIMADWSILRIHSYGPVKCGRVIWACAPKIKVTNFLHTHTQIDVFSLNQMEAYQSCQLCVSHEDVGAYIFHRLVKLLYLTACTLCLSYSYAVMSGIHTSTELSFHTQYPANNQTKLPNSSLMRCHNRHKINFNPH